MKTKREAIDWEEIFTYHISDKKIRIFCIQNILRTLMAHQQEDNTTVQWAKDFNT